MITYKKLFHLLLDRGIKKKDLQKMAGITPTIMARLAKDGNVQVDTIGKICTALDCQPGDIMENVPEKIKIKDTAPEVDEMDALILKAVLHPSIPPEGTKVITEKDVRETQYNNNMQEV